MAPAQHPTAQSPSPHRMGRGIKAEVSRLSHHAGTAQHDHRRLQLVIGETGELAGEAQLQQLALPGCFLLLSDALNNWQQVLSHLFPNGSFQWRLGNTFELRSQSLQLA